jgi:translation initiation factor 2 beta subunit (eIF-2beta)/eIF-5
LGLADLANSPLYHTRFEGKTPLQAFQNHLPESFLRQVANLMRSSEEPHRFALKVLLDLFLKETMTQTELEYQQSLLLKRDLIRKDLLKLFRKGLFT